MRIFNKFILTNKQVFFAISTVWIILLTLNYLREVRSVEKDVYAIALNEAENSYAKDIIYQKWVALEGGVYVPVSDYTKPNEFLHVPNRDIETKEGLKLTLINPAYMTRMVHQLESKGNGVKGHLTSLKPITPINNPDEWEKSALLLFEKGKIKVHTIVTENGKKYFRFIAPLITDEKCLKCHAQQGYKIGDIRGGLSVKIPYQKYEILASNHKKEEFILNFSIMCVGLIGLFIFYKHSEKFLQSIKSEKQKLDKILASIPNSVIIHANDKILFANKSAFKLFNVDENFDINSVSLSQIIHPNSSQLLKSRIDKILVDGITTEPARLKIISFDGLVKIIETVSLPFDYEGMPAILAIIKDVTQLVEAEKKLQEEREIFSSGPVVAFKWRACEGWIVDYVSKNCFEVLGYSQEEILSPGFLYSDLIHTDDIKRIYEEVKIFRENHTDNYTQEYRIRKRNGDYIWIYDVTNVIRDEQDDIKYYQGYIFDQTSSIKSKEMLKLSEEKFHLIFEASPDAISLTSLIEGKYVDVNKAFERLSGFSKNEIIGKTSVELGFWFSEKDRIDFVNKVVASGFTDESEISFRTRNKSKIICLVSTRLVTINNEKFILSIVDDITEKKKLDYISKKEEELTDILLELYKLAYVKSEKELFDFAIDQGVKLTDSKIGFFHKVNDDQDSIELVTWNSEARKQCSVVLNSHYPISQAGNWVECIKQKKSIIYNDYNNSPNQKGLPIGHVAVERFMSIPTFVNGKARLIFGVGNKEEEYNEFDKNNLEKVSNELARIIEKKLLNEKIVKSESELRSLHNANSTYIIKTDMDGNYTFVNPKFEETFGWIVEGRSFIGRNSLETIYFEDHQKCLDTVNKCIQNPETAIQVELRKPKKDGFHRTTVWEFTCKLDKEGNPKEFLCVGLDISERKRVEKELEIQKENLEKLVEQRTAELKQVNVELKLQLEREMALENQLAESLEKEKEINEMRTRFVATVSHEFRTPLSALLSSTQMVQRYARKWSDEKLSIHYDQIDKTVKYLTQLLDDILLVSRAEREILINKPEEINLDELLKTFVDEVSADKSHKQKITYHYNFEEKIFLIDPKLLSHVVLNLLSNAMKYSHDESRIVLMANGDADKIRISVQDEGIGIDKNELAYIFDPFYRTKNSVGIQGSGLGLNIVKRCVELMGGKISVESEIAKGSTFEIEIPVRKYSV